MDDVQLLHKISSKFTINGD